MARREVHAAALVDDACLQCFGQLDEQRHARWACAPGDRRRAPEFSRGDEHPRGFFDRSRFPLRRRRHRQLRDRQALALLDRVFLQPAVEHEHDRRHRRRQRDLVGAHGRFGEVGERPRRVVPLRVVADHRGRVLHAVVPLGRPSNGGVAVVAENHVDRYAVAPGVVEGHRRVLQADGAVGHHRQRLALGLEVGVGHRHRRLFVGAGEQLRALIAAVVDERFVQPAEARAGVRADVVEAERLEHVHHEVGSAALVVAHHLDVARRRSLRRLRHHRRGTSLGSRGSGQSRRGLRLGGSRRRHQCSRTGERALLQEPASLHELLRTLRSGHDVILSSCGGSATRDPPYVGRSTVRDPHFSHPHTPHPRTFPHPRTSMSPQYMMCRSGTGRPPAVSRAASGE